MESPNEIVISVVMTVYNGERFVREAIESILNQSFKNFEFMIVDDASEDDTPQIIRSFRDRRIVYMRNLNNLGQTKSLNLAIKRSRGKYIARMDADDVSCPERLKSQYEFLEQNPDIALVGSSIYVEQQGRKTLKFFQFPTDEIEIKCFLAGSGDLSYWCLAHPTVTIRRQILEEVGLYDEKKGEGQGYPQDYELWNRLTRRYRFANLEQPLLKYRVSLHSDSRAFIEKQFQARLAITAEKIKYYLSDIDEQSIASLCHMLEYHPQKSSADGKRLFALFDVYYDRYVGELKNNETAVRIKQQLKLYYLPQLFITNKVLALREALRLFVVYPLFLFDKKLYRKLLKVFLLKIIPEQRQMEFLMRHLLYR